jgi:hypothetical protein
MTEPERAEQPQSISPDEVLAALKPILRSKTFVHASSLRQALEFIVRKSLSSPVEPIKEYTLATEVLSRGSDFDPKIDNIVRVQMHRLREKLEEYYLTEGQRDSVRIVMPRGQYSPEYVRKTADVQPTTADSPQQVGVLRKRGWHVDWRCGTAIALVICGLVLVARHLWPSITLPSCFRLLWEPFLMPTRPPLIVYSNPGFLVSKQGNLYRYDSPQILSLPMGTRLTTLDNQGVQLGSVEESPPLYYFDGYTGSGEVMATARIVQFLTAHSEPFFIKRSHLVSYEDIKENNVIFLGSSKEDQILKDLPASQELMFMPPPPDQYPIGSFIQDLDPPPGQPATYRMQVDNSTGAIQAEYGLISLLPGVFAGRYVLVIAGITTLGTQGAADFLTSGPDMALLERMPVVAAAIKSHSHYLQVLIKLEVRDGVPLNVSCVLVRKLNPAAR